MYLADFMSVNALFTAGEYRGPLRGPRSEDQWRRLVNELSEKGPTKTVEQWKQIMGEKEQVIQALRATLLSVKGALTLKQVNRDFRELQGEWIPYQKLGYPSLEKLFLDVPGFKVNQNNGEWYVDAIASQQTQHIASMVAKQKSNKKTAKFSNPPRFPKRQDSWRKPSFSGSYSTNYSNEYSNQYYRAKSGFPSSFNNNYSKKYPNKNHEQKPSFSNTKQSKPAAEPAKPTMGPSKPTMGAFKPTMGPSKSTMEASKPTMGPSKSTMEASKPTSESNGFSKHMPNHVSLPEPKPDVLGLLSKRIEMEKAMERPAKHSSKSVGHRMAALRSNTVDVIPLQLPAAAAAAKEIPAAAKETSEKSGPVTNVTPAYHLEPPPDSSTPVARLEWTCQKLGLPAPVCKVFDHKPKGSAVCYDCSIKVGQTYSASSYPISAPSEELARERAAVKMLTLIESLEVGGLVTSSPGAAVDALVTLVAEHEAGLWASTVPHLYREKYQENLPTNWQELVENCPRIIKDRVVNGLLVLLPNKEEPLGAFQGLESSSVSSDDSIDNDLPPLQFPNDSFWNVYVTVANSTLEIWLRIIGPDFSDAYESLLEEMAQYYDHNGIVPDKACIINNCWYAVNVEDGGWQRAKVLEVEDDRASVFLGDHGDEDVVSIMKIKVLEPQFRNLPAQAILCRLEGAEELGSSPEAAELVRRRLVGEVLVAAPGARDDPADPAVCIVLYDTSTQRDLNLNKEIVHDFCMANVFTITQKPSEAEVCCVTEEGRVWLSSINGMNLVRTAMELVTAGPYRRHFPTTPRSLPPPATDITQAPLFIVRTLDEDWVRCVIISGLDGEGTVRTQLVDNGLVMRVPMTSLVPLHSFSPVLNKFPHQAVAARLGGVNDRAAADMSWRIRELALGKRVLCRVVPPNRADGARLPIAVELFVRSGAQAILASVNNAIQIENQVQDQPKEKEIDEQKVTDIVEALNRRKERIFRSASSAGSLGEDSGHAAASPPPPPPACASPLPPPGLPDIDQCIDVYVAMAANPWNFVVQYNGSRPRLQALMAAMQEECPKIPESRAPKNPVSGELYTVYYDKDSSWYRVIIAGTVSTEMVSVYFCDYGDLALFPNKALRPVPDKLTDARTFPPQAIKAKLYDVWPLHQDWSVEDCIRFQELCVEQQFVAICKHIGRDPLNPNEPLLTLDLVDTSTTEDVYVRDQLVAEERAKSGSSKQ